MNKVVYTAILDNYEGLKQNQANKNADFIAYMSYPVNSEMWQVKEPINVFSNPRRNARWHKVNAHLLDYDYSLWIDGSMEIKQPIDWFIETYLKDADIAVFRHPDRNCLYQEAEVCSKIGFDDPNVIEKQIKRYKKEGYPEENGLGETKIVLRKHSPKVEEFNRLWLHEITNFSLRDQISFNYCVWKSGIKLNYIELLPEAIWDRYPGCLYTKHKRVV
jgi:hypothetical protein